MSLMSSSMLVTEHSLILKMQSVHVATLLSGIRTQPSVVLVELQHVVLIATTSLFNLRANVCLSATLSQMKPQNQFKECKTLIG